TFTARNFEGRVPQPGELTEQDRAMLESARGAFERVGAQIEGCHFKEALREVMALAAEANRYLDDTAPWKALKTERAGVGGQALGTPTPLFEKLDEARIAEENERLGEPWTDPEGPITEDRPQERVVIFEGQVRTRRELGEEF